MIKATKRIGLAAGMIGLMTVASGQAIAGPVTTTVYSGFVDHGTSISFTGNVLGTLSTNDIQFGTDTGYNFHPFGATRFGTDSVGNIDAATASTYTFTLRSDDGSYLFIDGHLVINNGGPHVATTKAGSVTLSAGLHSFEVQFFEDFGNPSGLDLNLPAGVTYTAVPEPSAAALAGTAGLMGLGYNWRRRRAGAKAAA